MMEHVAKIMSENTLMYTITYMSKDHLICNLACLKGKAQSVLFLFDLTVAFFSERGDFLL